VEKNELIKKFQEIIEKKDVEIRDLQENLIRNIRNIDFQLSLLNDQRIIIRKDEEFTKLNFEIEVLRHKVFENLIAIKDLNRELEEKNFQFNNNIQIKQSEIDRLNNLNMKLQFEVSQYEDASGALSSKSNLAKTRNSWM
jgi:FtsZ-binding cell division protein ZapB